MVGQLHLENAPFILALDFSSGLAAAITRETPVSGFVALLLCTAAVLFERPPLKPAMRLTHAHTAISLPCKLASVCLPGRNTDAHANAAGTAPSWPLPTTAYLLPI